MCLYVPAKCSEQRGIYFKLLLLDAIIQSNGYDPIEKNIVLTLVAYP